MKTGLNQPFMDAIPSELTRLKRWVVWRSEGGKKIPYSCANPKQRIDITSPASYSSFEHACEVYRRLNFTGIGFVLNGDGVVGVDLDDCIINGQPDPRAIAILDRLGCQYVEVSPSGEGLRAFGYGHSTCNARGVVDGIKVELYASKRYLTVTGNAFRRGPLVDLHGWSQILASIKQNRTEVKEVTEETEVFEDTENTESSGGVLSTPIGEILLPHRATPTMTGQRHQCLFHLARHLKTLFPSACADEMLNVVRAWFEKFKHVIATKDWDVTWAEFKTAWSNVRVKYGQAVLQEVLSCCSAPPPELLRPGYSTTMEKLISVCVALQQHHAPQPFFLSCRVAGEILQLGHSHAATLIKSLIQDGVLEVVEEATKTKSRRFRIKQQVPDAPG